jgi:hypothetical protein
MVNRSKQKGTSTETLVVNYFRANGWPYAERRALSGNLDKGDIAGMPGLCVEVKYGNETLKIGPWLTETGIERLNAGADHGVLVVKPFGMGEKNVGRFYAVMVAHDFEVLAAKAANVDMPMFVVNGQPGPYSGRALALEIAGSLNTLNLAPREVFALALKPPGTKDKPERWYRVMTLHHMTRLLRAAGYGDPESVEAAAIS